MLLSIAHASRVLNSVNQRVVLGHICVVAAASSTGRFCLRFCLRFYSSKNILLRHKRLKMYFRVFRNTKALYQTSPKVFQNINPLYKTISNSLKISSIRLRTSPNNLKMPSIRLKTLPYSLKVLSIRLKTSPDSLKDSPSSLRMLSKALRNYKPH